MWGVFRRKKAEEDRSQPTLHLLAIRGQKVNTCSMGRRRDTGGGKRRRPSSRGGTSLLGRKKAKEKEKKDSRRGGGGKQQLLPGKNLSTGGKGGI